MELETYEYLRILVDRVLKKWYITSDWYLGNFRSPKSISFMGENMKEYKNNQELLEHLISKGVIVENEQEALAKFEKYTYYSIVNTYKEVFKDNGKYLDGVTFDEIYSLYEFDKNLKSIFLKYALEIELVIKALIANTIAEKYGVKNYLNRQSFDMNADTNSVKKTSI